MKVKKKDWFADWFNSPYYHRLYKNRDEKEAKFFLDHLLDFLNPPLHSKMLDVACGKGRHANYLNKKGYHVTGFDLSEESIAFDKKFENESLSFFVHDMRDIFRVDHYDYVFNLFTSFGYFHEKVDNIKTIEAHAAALKKGGTLVLDYFNAEKIICNMAPQEEKSIEGILFNIRKKIAGGCLLKTIDFTHDQKDFHFEEELIIFYADDFRKIFSDFNLEIKNIFGDYSLNNFDRNISDRLILIAEKI